jgi:hypothetical protein
LFDLLNRRFHIYISSFRCGWLLSSFRLSWWSLFRLFGLLRHILLHRDFFLLNPFFLEVG